MSCYRIEADAVDHGERYWKTQIVTIFRDDEPIGNYEYLYSGRVPWKVFSQNGKDYALFAEHYTATKVMALPSCETVAGEEPGTFGFCPVEFSVDADGLHGSVNGCVWGGPYGDRPIDLSNIDYGVIAFGEVVDEDVEYDDDEDDDEDEEQSA